MLTYKHRLLIRRIFGYTLLYLLISSLLFFGEVLQKSFDENYYLAAIGALGATGGVFLLGFVLVAIFWLIFED